MQSPTPQPTITPFAYTWRIAGEGATPKPDEVDNAFVTSNKDFDTTHRGDYDGDLMPGDPGAIPAGGGQGSAVDNISCDTTMSNNYHVHAFIGLYYNGKQIVIPDGLGIVNAGGDVTDGSTGWPNQEDYGTCFYHIHTHDDTGMIHLEDPNPTGATIDQSIFSTGNLFDIWGVQVSTSQFGPFSGPLAIYTSGQFSRAHQCVNGLCEVGSNMYTQYLGDPMSIPIYSHEVIWFEIGTGNPDAAHLPGVSFAVSQ